jgi:hypothetical protein
MENKIWYKDASMIMAVCAVMVSVIALGVGVYESKLEREYQSASVWPRLEVFRSYQSGDLSYQVTNSGIGPAIVKTAKVSAKGIYYSTWREALSDVLDVEANKGFQIGNSHISSRVLTADKTIKIMYITNDTAEKLAHNDIIGIELCYCSVFDECWIIDRNNNPKSVKQCNIDEEQQFKQ